MISTAVKNILKSPFLWVSLALTGGGMYQSHVERDAREAFYAVVPKYGNPGQSLSKAQCEKLINSEFDSDPDGAREFAQILQSSSSLKMSTTGQNIIEVLEEIKQ